MAAAAVLVADGAGDEELQAARPATTRAAVRRESDLRTIEQSAASASASADSPAAGRARRAEADRAPPTMEGMTREFSVPQSRHVATALPGPRSQELQRRREAVVSRGAGTLALSLIHI